MTVAAADLGSTLRSLGFRTSPEALAALLTHATKSRLGPVEILEQFVALEQRERDRRNLVRRTKIANLGAVTPLSRFDWDHPREINRPLVEQLMSLAFVARGDNVLLRGPSGVGKTMLARCLCQAALEQGYRVRFATLAAAMGDLLKQESLPAIERRLRRYVSPSLLVLDEVGYLPCDSRSADLLYHIIGLRHEARSTVITTNLGFKQWGTVFPGAACVGAITDRFTEHCHFIDIEADSYRQKRRTAPSPPPTITSPARRDPR